MDFIKQWVLSVCVSLILSVVFSLLTPRGNMGRIYKVILALFIFISFILPLKSGDVEINIPDFDVQLSQSGSDTYNELISASVKSTLDQGGYTSCIIECDVEYSNDEIEVESLTVGTPAHYDCGEVKNYIFENLGMVAEVYHIGR